MRKRIVFVFLFAACLWTVGYGGSHSNYDTLLRLSQKEFENQNFVKSLEHLMEILYTEDTKLSDDRRMTVLTSMGIIYAEILNYEKAMECFLESHQIISGKSNIKEEVGILNNIAILYMYANNWDKATEYLDIAYQTVSEIKDSSKMVLLLLNNMSIISNKKGDWKQTEKYLHLAMEITANNPQYSQEILLLKHVKVEYLYLKKEYDSAERLALDVLSHDVKTVSRELEIEYLVTLSKIYKAKKNIPQAIYYAKKSLESNANLPMIINIYEHLASLYRAANSHSLALQCQDSVIMMKDSLLKLNNMSQILRGQVQFDLSNMEKKLAANKEKQKRDQIIFLFVFLFFAVVSSLFIYMRSIKSKRLKIVAELEKNEKLLLEQRLKEQETQALLEQEQVNNEIKEKMLLKQQLKEQETLALLEQERVSNEIKEKMLLKQELKEQETLALLRQKMYSNEIELKNKQLVTKTLFQLSKNELLEEIIQELSHIPNQSRISELQPIIQKLKSQLKEPAGSDWTSFLTYFEQTNPSFLFTLKERHSDLTANDIRLASYIYLNLDTKEISKLLNITPDHCNKKKQRLGEKLGIPTSKVYSYLMNLA